VEQGGELVEGDRRARVLSHDPAAQRHGLAKEGLRPSQVALGLEQGCETAQGVGHVTVVVAQELAAHRQRLAEQRLRPGQVALATQDDRQIVEALGDVLVLLAEALAAE
jgi:hypothetical protein